MNVIKKEDYLFGIRHWMQVYQNRIPYYDVFRYVGVNHHTGIYYFQSVRTKALIGKGFYQLNKNGFVPFCLDWKRVESYLDSQGGPNAAV